MERPNLSENHSAIMHSMLELDVVPGPAVNSLGPSGVDDSTHQFVMDSVESLIHELGIHPFATLTRPDVTIEMPIVRIAFGETIMSTAAYLSHLRLGYLKVDEAMVSVASRLLHRVLTTNDLIDTLQTLTSIQYYDNAMVLKYYGRVTRQRFITGELHRPSILYSLKDELDLMFAAGNVEQFDNGEETMLRLTPKGSAMFTEIGAMLKQTGFLSRRASLLRLSYFSQLTDYDELIESITPARSFRVEIMDELKKVSLPEHSRVLELGCGTGCLTIDAGLSDYILPQGELVATEPSFGMLMKAKRKSEIAGHLNVRFMQMIAEDLQFDDNTFELVTGAGYLQFTDVERGIKEAHRVLKPGGTFMTAYPLNFPVNIPFFAEWFEPILRLMPKDVTRQASFPEQDDVPNAMSGRFEDIELRDAVYLIDYRNTRNAVRFFVQVANIFEPAMYEVPWKAKQDLIEELMRRGEKIALKYSRDNMMVNHPAQFVRAQVIK